MKKFSRHRALVELKPLCAARNITIDTTRHDAVASDFITLQGVIGGKSMTVVYSVFNGTFIGRLGLDGDGFAFNHQSKLDDEPWFAAVLELLYVEKEAAHG